MMEAPTLFEMGTAATGNPRQRQIDAALAKAQAVWKERYIAFILDFAETATEDFTAEDVREKYCSTPGLPRTEKEQASGGIFQRLVKDRKLQPSGMKRSKRFGNLLQSYVKW